MLISDQYQLSFLDKTSAAYLKAESGRKVETFLRQTSWLTIFRKHEFACSDLLLDLISFPTSTGNRKLLKKEAVKVEKNQHEKTYFTTFYRNPHT